MAAELLIAVMALFVVTVGCIVALGFIALRVADKYFAFRAADQQFHKQAQFDLLKAETEKALVLTKLDLQERVEKLEGRLQKNELAKLGGR